MSIGPGTGPVVHPPGGVPPEDIELLRRRIGAVFMRVIGILMLVAFIPAGIFVLIDTESWQAALIVVIILLVVGIILEWYGGYLYRKYQHIMWTKQAIREYEQQRMHYRMEAAEAYRLAMAAGYPPVEVLSTPAQTPPPEKGVSRPASCTAVAGAKLILPNGSEIPLVAADRWVGRNDLRQTLASNSLELVSREHILISYISGRFYLEDQKSTNGTKLNGIEIKGKGRFELRDGDIIELAGVAKLTFRAQ